MNNTFCALIVMQLIAIGNSVQAEHCVCVCVRCRRGCRYTDPRDLIAANWRWITCPRNLFSRRKLDVFIVACDFELHQNQSVQFTNDA